MKKHLLTTTALAGLAAFAASPALAFDENNWTWNKDVTELVDINVTINSDITPDGHFELQDRQFYTGDVVARSTISGDYLSNDAEQPSGIDGVIDVEVEVPISGILRVSGDYDANAEGPNIIGGTVDVDEVEGLDITDANVRTGTSQISVQPSNYQLNFDIAGTATGVQQVDLGEIELEGVTLDATTELANGAASSTAIANFKNIDSEAFTELHEIQDHVAENNNGAGVLAEATAGSLENPVALAVELDSTAISNLLTVNVASADGFIGDVSQTTNANMLAEVSANQDLSGFNSLGSYAGLMDSEGAAIAGRMIPGMEVMICMAPTIIAPVLPALQKPSREPSISIF